MKQMMVWMMLFALLLTGCVVPPATINTVPTVEDLFTVPVTKAPATEATNPATGPTATDPTQATEPKQPSVSIPLGGMGFGIKDDKKQLDEFGSYYVYEGGEMCLRFMLQAEGQTLVNCVEQGIGIQLMVDGQPQPYRVAEEGELAYFHVLYPAFDTENALVTQFYYFNLYFTPIAGEAGETVEFFCSTICDPDWQTGEPLTAWNYTFGATQLGTRLKLNAVPPKIEKPEVTERINSVDISYVDTSYSEIAGWSDMDLIEKYDFEFKVDGQPYPGVKGSKIYDVSADKLVELRFEVWGTPYVKYGLMFYVDNQPISGQEVIHFDMKNGQKTVITVMMDLSDFDGEAAIYAALIPLNCRTTEILTMAFLNMGKTYYMVDDPKPEN